ncbi:uncharacterized protein PSFLO_04480 [Pseudozyma flocculosa]|uniref:Uncharacterized protein n=1 Tax=Pseudozyma flocculosa TaxID=84751 RepID=A0A5C3F6V5_9BASI|nr:uncharacterized protein PSFLO_04480 [Pseudozyma flocculosa]
MPPASLPPAASPCSLALALVLSGIARIYHSITAQTAVLTAAASDPASCPAPPAAAAAAQDDTPLAFEHPIGLPVRIDHLVACDQPTTFNNRHLRSSCSAPVPHPIASRRSTASLHVTPFPPSSQRVPSVAYHWPARCTRLPSSLLGRSLLMPLA